MLKLAGPAKWVKPILQESGGHRWQRVPPSERRGRVHTSTVTVAVFESVADHEWVLRDTDIKVFTTRDSGPGGQHRNTTDSCVVMRHLPTGIEAKAATKSQHQNRRDARSMLEARVRAEIENRRVRDVTSRRRELVGSGMRGDKIRTYRVKDQRVIDHLSGKSASLPKVLKGSLELLR